MNMSKGAIVAATLLAATGAANAGKLAYTDIAEGLERQIVMVDGVAVEVLSQPRGTAYEDGGTGGVGVYGGGADTEVGLADYLQFSFDSAVNLTRLDINKLFSSAASSDSINEGITVTTDNGTYTFVAHDTSANSVIALPDIGGDIINLSSPDDSGSGRWKFRGDALFGGPITFLRIEPDVPGIFPSVSSDFTFMGLNFNPVPTPGSMALLGLGGIATLRRRR